MKGSCSSSRWSKCLDAVVAAVGDEEVALGVEAELIRVIDGPFAPAHGGPLAQERAVGAHDLGLGDVGGLRPVRLQPGDHHRADGGEALADDGKLSGRGTPLLRGLVCGLMTMAGGIGHTIPYLIPDFWTATAVASVVVVFELLAIAVIQWRYMDTSPVSAAANARLNAAFTGAVRR